MKILKVKLKQHTPLVHFQHDQYGATLRASEVKPLLDKYIVSNVFMNDFLQVKPFLKTNSTTSDDDLEKKFEKGFRALDYQLKIIAGGEQKLNVKLNIHTKVVQERQTNGMMQSVTKFVTDDFPMLLSNMGGNDAATDLVNLVLHDYVEMTIITDNEILLGKLRQILPKFFAVTNFGQRSTKGFGSFTVYSFDSETPIKWDASLYYEKGCPYMGFYVATEKDISEKLKQSAIMGVIDFYWKCLKSGINYTRNARFPDRYIKSYIYVFLNSILNKTWEKRRIKTFFGLGAHIAGNANPHEPIFARGLLGCPDKYSFGNIEIKVEHSENNDSSDKIARIPAPIYFKPVCIGKKVYVYLLFNDKIISSLKAVQNRNFHFSVNNIGFDMNLDVFLRKNNYNFLIDYFHEYLSFNENVLSALYSEQSRDSYHPMTGGQLEDEDYGFVPRDFNWKNILYDDQCVIFNNI